MNIEENRLQLLLFPIANSSFLGFFNEAKRRKATMSLPSENLIRGHIDTTPNTGRLAAQQAATLSGGHVDDLPVLGIDPLNSVPPQASKLRIHAKKQDMTNKGVAQKYVILANRNPYAGTMKPGQLMFCERKVSDDETDINKLVNFQTLNLILEELADQYPTLESVLSLWNFVGIFNNDGVAGRIVHSPMTNERVINVIIYGFCRNIELLWPTTHLRPLTTCWLILKKVRLSAIARNSVDPAGRTKKQRQLTDKMRFQWVPYAHYSHPLPPTEELEWEEDGIVHRGHAFHVMTVGTDIPVGHTNSYLAEASRIAVMPMEILPGYVRV